VDALLEGAVFGAETVRRDFKRDGGNANEERVGIHPPGKPGFEVGLASEFVDEVTVIIEDGAIADYVRCAAGSVKFCSDLRVKNPELAFDGGCCVHGKRRLARDFGDEVDVVTGFFEQGADFVGESGLADAVSADES